jgi:hypothetical protein
MLAQSVDPRTDAEWEAGPIHSFRVIFWPSPTRSDEYDLLEADDVRAAIEWADAEAKKRGCTYTLYAKVTVGSPGLAWLAGIDPTSSGSNFSRAQPAS